MRARIFFSRSAAVVTALALAAAACESTPPAKTADAPPQPTAQATATAAPTSEPAAAATATAAPTVAVGAGQKAESAPVVDGYVFKKTMPAVGAKVAEKETKTMNLTIEVGGKTPKDKLAKVVKGEKKTIDKTVEVLAVSADAITKVKVSYKDHSKVESKDGADKTTKAPVMGKTYVVEAKDGAVNVTTEKGVPAPAEEAALVQDDFKRLGKPNELQSALPATPLKIGDKVDSLGQSLRDKVAKDDDGKTKTTVESSSVTLAKVNESGGSKTGVFDVILDLAMDQGGMIIKMKMKGQVELRMDDGFPVSMSFQAPITVSTPAGAGGPSIRGGGLAKFEGTRQLL